MREFETQPKAVVHRVTSTDGVGKYLLMTWEPLEADRRLVAIHPSLSSAEQAVPWPSRQGGPPAPGLPPEARREYDRRQQALKTRIARRSGERVPVQNVPPEQAWG